MRQGATRQSSMRQENVTVGDSPPPHPIHSRHALEWVVAPGVDECNQHGHDDHSVQLYGLGGATRRSWRSVGRQAGTTRGTSEEGGLLQKRASPPSSPYHTAHHMHGSELHNYGMTRKVRARQGDRVGAGARVAAGRGPLHWPTQCGNELTHRETGTYQARP